MAEDASLETAATRAKRILLICQMDRYANGVKPARIAKFLRERGHDVHVENTYYLSRASGASDTILSKLPRPGFRRLAIYAAELCALLFTRRWRFGRRHLSYYTFLADYRLRSSLLRSLLPLDEFDLIMCEHPHDAGLLALRTSAIRLYDAETPYADEVYCEGRLTDSQHRRFRRLEKDLYEGVDVLSFSWESYVGYAIQHYGISGKNIRQLNWGCVPSKERAEFSDPPRIVYIGSLSSRFITLPLLSRLTKLYPRIDVYGGPPPDPSLGLNYLGWAAPEILQGYQMGLITCTEDELRKDGFSAKHLDYIAYGLPVLVPAWRRHMELLRGSVPYDEQTFTSVVAALSKPDAWRRAADESYEQAQLLTWDRTLQPLEDLLATATARGVVPTAG